VSPPLFRLDKINTMKVIQMKYHLLASLMLVTSPLLVQASESCSIDPELLGATYEMTDSDSNKTATMMLWRQHGRVSNQFTQTGVTDMWEYTHNGQLRMVRFFDKEQHAIEYQPGEVKYANADSQWQQVHELITDKLKNNMTLVSTSGEACDKVETYQLTEGDSHLQLEWLPALSLVKSWKNTADGHIQTWQLTKLIKDESAVNASFKMRDDYQTTDYADIGDSESDPFIAKMINQGYIDHGPSGFYNSEGEDIGHPHHH
jgi:hypothetical protein